MDILDRIIELLGNKDQQELTNYLKLKKVAFSDWKSGKSKSYLKYLIEISEFFNVSIDYLVYGKEKDSSIPKLSDEEQELLYNYNKLSNINKEKIMERIETLLEIEKEKDNEN